MRLGILFHLVHCGFVQCCIDVFTDVYESARFVDFVGVAFEIAFDDGYQLHLLLVAHAHRVLNLLLCHRLALFLFLLGQILAFLQKIGF